MPSRVCRPKRETVDDDIGCPGQLFELPPSLAAVQIEADAALASIPDPVPGLLRKRIARGRLDPYDVGTVVGQEHGGHGAGDAPGQVEDAQIFECSSHTTPPLHIPVASTIVSTMSLHDEAARKPGHAASGTPPALSGSEQYPLNWPFFDPAGVWAQPAIDGSERARSSHERWCKGPPKCAGCPLEHRADRFPLPRGRRTRETVMSLILSSATEAPGSVSSRLSAPLLGRPAGASSPRLGVVATGRCHRR